MRMRRHVFRQRGAVAVLAAVAMVAMLAALALAVDVGRLYYSQRDLQRIANLAALDAARVATECLGSVDDKLSAAQTEAARSVVGNGGKPDYLGADAVSLGAKVVQNGIRVFESTSADKAYAVQVRVSTAPPGRLLPALTGGSGAQLLVATAAAESVRVATVDAQPKLLGVNPSEPLGPLEPLIGPNPVNVNVGGVQGLANATVKLGDLAAEVGAGGPDEFLTTEIAGVDLLDALVNLTSGAVSQTLAEIAGAMDQGAKLVPGDAIGVPPGWEDPAEDSLINVGATVIAALQQANRNRPLDATIQVEVPGVTNGPATITTRQTTGSRSAAGPAGRNPDGDPLTTSHTSTLYAQLDLPLIDLAGNAGNIKLFVEAPEASAWLTDIRCSRLGQTQPVVDVQARSSAVRIGIGEFDDIEGPNPVSKPTQLFEQEVLGVKIKVSAHGVVSMGNDTEVSLTYTGPFAKDEPQWQSFGVPPSEALSGALDDLASTIEITVEPPAAELNPLIKPVVDALRQNLPGALAQALQAVSGDLIEPALLLAGVTIGGADVGVSDVKGGAPKLFTH